MPSEPLNESRALPAAKAIGGPVYRLYHRYAPDRPTADGLRRLAVPALAWLPLAMLAMWGARRDAVPFLLDLEVHLKLLVALPILVTADRIAHPRLTGAVQQFVERGVVAPPDRGRFEAAVARAGRIRDSSWLEAIVVALVYSAGHWVWREQIALEVPTWYASPSPTGPVLTAAGLWYTFVSAPIFRFLVLLWYARLAIWFALLWRISRLDLRLTPTHPDRCGGIGFVGNSLFAFSPFLFAQGVLLSGLIANRIFHEGRSLISFKMDTAGIVALVLGLLVAPLFVFSPHLVLAKRRGLRQYGELASRYVQEFDDKWVGGKQGAGEPLVGSADIQSLADLGNSYSVVREMRTVPFGTQTLYRLAIALVAPLLPLLLTAIPVEQLLDRLLRLLL